MTRAGWIIGIVVVLAVIGLAQGDGEDSGDPNEPGIESNDWESEEEIEPVFEPEPDFEVSASDLVDLQEAMHPGQRREACESIEILGRDLAQEGFEQGYTGDEPGAPSPEAVFDEMASRC
jgi:hypothetical protein